MNPFHRISRAVTLLETTVALFILSGALLVVVALFHSGFQYQRRTGLRAEASLLLREKAAEIQRYSRTLQSGQYGFDLLTGWDGRTEEPAEHPGLVLEYQVTPRTILSPCDSFEARITTDRQRTMNSFLDCQLTATFSGGKEFYVFRIGDPPREPDTNPIQLNRTNSPTLPLAKDNPSVDYRAEFRDVNGEVIPGVMFTWLVVPETGNASVEASRDGRLAKLRNFTFDDEGSLTHTGGSVRLSCRARYRGVQFENLTESIALEP